MNFIFINKLILEIFKDVKTSFLQYYVERIKKTDS